MDRFAIVTGASSGIGLELGRTLVQQGFEVWGLSRRQPPGDSGIKGMQLDLSSLDSLNTWVHQTLEPKLNQWEGELVLVHNAGDLGPVVPQWRLEDFADFQRSFNLHVLAGARLAQSVLARVQQGGRLKVTLAFMISGAATKAYEGWGSYCSCKAALRMLLMVLAKESKKFLEQPGIDLMFYNLDPGPTSTSMQDDIRQMSPENLPNVQRFVELHQDEQLNLPKDIAADFGSMVFGDHRPYYVEKRVGAPPSDVAPTPQDLR